MKRTKVLVMTLAISMIAASPVLAEWKMEDDGRWWYQNEDGSYPANQWQEIEGKQYYFGEDGYMLANTTTPDGKQVGADGAQIDNIQTGDGTRGNPYNAYVGADFSYNLTYFPEYNYSARLKLLEVVTGQRANEWVFSENMFNESEHGNYKWRLYHFELTCLDSERELSGDVVNPSDFYNQDSTIGLSDAKTAVLGDRLKSRYNVKLYPGGTDDFWVGILIDESIPYVTFKIGTGKGEVWFTTKQK